MALGLWLLVACDGAAIGRDTGTETGWGQDSDPDTSLTTWHGDAAGAGLGASLATQGDDAWAAAPWGEVGQVLLLVGQGQPVLGDSATWSLGYGLAVSSEAVVAAGAPLAGDGAGAIAATDGTWVVGSPGDVRGGRLMWHGDTLWSAGGAALWQGEDRTALPARVGGLAVLDGQALVGLPRGPDALWRDGESWARPSDHDEAGYALCAADLDSDGVTDLAVGAPGSDRVLLLLGPVEGWDLQALVLHGPAGRFGHALACDPGALAVGAPLGDHGHGAAWMFEGDPLDWEVGAPRVTGQALGEHLGSAVGLTPNHLWVGAPEADHGAGRVDRLSR